MIFSSNIQLLETTLTT